MSNIDLKQQEREQSRWLILSVLNAARPIGTNEGLILSTIQSVLPGVTQQELRREMTYLEDRKLIEISNQHTGAWFGKLTRYGVDLVEYTVPVDPGIARPVRYW